MAAADGNAALIDRITAHAIDLTRFEVGAQRKVLAILATLEREAVARLSSGPLTSFQDQRTRQLLADIKATVEQHYSRAQQVMADKLFGLSEIETAFIGRAIKAIAPAFDISSILSAGALQSASSESLIQGAPSASWWRRQAGDTSIRFTAAVRQGIAGGEASGKIVSRIRDAMAISRRNAESLVRTSVQTVANETRVASYAALDGVVGVQQLSTLDSRTSDICLGYAGKKWKKTSSGSYKPDGHSLPWNGGPPRHWGCRSTTVPLLDIDEEIEPGTQSSDQGPVSAGLSMDAFLRGKPAAYVDDLLGKGRAQLFLDKKITLTDLLDQRGRPLSLAQLRERANT